MTHKLSDKPSLVTVPYSQNVTKAGDLSSTKKDFTGVPITGGLTVRDGYALCNGATYDELVFPQLHAALGSPVVKEVPNGPYRTRTLNWGDLTFTNTPAGWAERWAYVVFYSDDNNQWRMKFNIGASITATTGKVSVGINGVDFANNSSTGNQAISFIDNGNGAQKEGAVEGDTNTIATDLDTSRSFFLVSGDVALNAKPSFAGFDDYLESYPVIACYDNVASNAIGLPEPTAETSGLVPNYKKVVGHTFPVSGFSDLTEVSGDYILNGDQVNIHIPAFEGTSNANNINITLPTEIQRTTDSAWYILMPAKDNGVIGSVPAMGNVLASGVFRTRKDLSAGFYTISGVKGFANGITFTYMKD